MLARARSDLSASTAAARAGLARDPNLPYVADWLVRDYHLLGLREEALVMAQGRLGGRYRKLWLSGDREGLQRLVRNAPAPAAESGEALFTLGTLRDWPAIARLHSSRLHHEHRMLRCAHRMCLKHYWCWGTRHGERLSGCINW